MDTLLPDGTTIEDQGLGEEKTSAPTPEQIESDFWAGVEAKAAELTEKANGRTVLSFSLPGDEIGEHVVGYMYEPDDDTYNKLTWAKLIGGDGSLARAKEQLETLVWWHESDPNMRSRENLNGAALFLLGQVKVKMPEFKKK